MMLSPSTQWIQLIPAGTFSTNDGRGPFYNYEPQAVVRVSREFLKGGLPIDFDHATDRAAPEGRPAPAVGWIRDFRVVAGAIQGRVEWTPLGAAALKAKEYRFISPVLQFDPPAGSDKGAMTGRVLFIRRAALTNNPALDQLPALAASRIELTRDEKKICAAMGTSEEEYAAEKARRQRLYGTRTATAATRTTALDAAIERQLKPMLRELRALADVQAGATPAAREMSAEDKKLCWLTGMSPATLMAAREKHEQTVIASRSDAEYIRRTFGPSRVPVADLCGGKK
jgi:Mu-like prophage I protein